MNKILEAFDEKYRKAVLKNYPEYAESHSILLLMDIKAFLRSALIEQIEDLKKEVEKKRLSNEGKPDTQELFAHYNFGSRVGYNQAIEDFTALLDKKLE